MAIRAPRDEMDTPEQEIAALRRLLDSSGDAVLRLAGDGTVLFANATVRTRCLIDAAATAEGRPLADVAPDALVRPLLGLARQVLDGGAPATADFPNPNDRMPVSARAFPCDADSVSLFLRFLGSADLPGVDDRRTAAEAQVAALFDHAPVGFSFFDRNGRFVRINPTMAEINGLAVEDHIGRRIDDVLPDIGPQCLRVIETVLQTGEALPVYEIIGETPAAPGVRRHFLCGWFPVHLNGTVAWAGAAVSEVTALRQAEEERAQLAAALDRERAVLKAVLDQMPAGVVAVDAADGRVILHNEEAQRLLGHELTPVAFTGAVALGGLHPDGTPLAAEDYPVVQALKEGRPTGLTEMLYRRGDGVVVTLAVRAAPVVTGGGGPRMAVASFHDISHRKAMEDALRRAKEEAERADLAKSRFLAAASHDLRQPMQSLFFFAESLNRHVFTRGGRERLAQLQGGLDALKGLLDSLLDVSRLDANMIEPRLEPTPLESLLTDLAAAYEGRASEKGLTFTVEGCPYWVSSDRTLLARILRNLVENALRYTEAGGITVGCAPVGLSDMEIAVRDTGIGIPPEHLERVWEEFHQVNNPERDRDRGLGLGLAIVRRLSDLLGYTVRVESREGSGSTFFLRVPLAEPPAEDEAPAAVPPPPAPRPSRPVRRSGGEKALVLVIDDDAIVLMGTEAQVQDWGYEVIGATSGEEAVAALRRDGRIPDVVLADYRLRAGETGMDAVRRVHRLCGAVPALILTGETSPDTQREITAAGHGLIHKPATPSQLRTALEARLAMGREP